MKKAKRSELEKAVTHIDRARGNITKHLSECGSTAELLDLSHTLYCVKMVIDSRLGGLNVGAGLIERACGTTGHVARVKELLG